MRALILLTVATVCHMAAGQNPALEALNAAFDGRVKFSIDKEDRLIVDHYDETGRFRQDQVYVDMLDPASVAWIAEENAIVVKCAAAHEQCIEKEVFKVGSLKHTNRMNLAMTGSESTRHAAMEALVKLLQNEQERIAQRMRETNTRPKRNKAAPEKRP